MHKIHLNLDIAAPAVVLWDCTACKLLEMLIHFSLSRTSIAKIWNSNFIYVGDFHWQQISLALYSHSGPRIFHHLSPVFCPDPKALGGIRSGCSRWGREESQTPGICWVQWQCNRWQSINKSCQIADADNTFHVYFVQAGNNIKGFLGFLTWIKHTDWLIDCYISKYEHNCNNCISAITVLQLKCAGKDG